MDKEDHKGDQVARYDLLKCNTHVLYVLALFFFFDACVMCHGSTAMLLFYKTQVSDGKR